MCEHRVSFFIAPTLFSKTGYLEFAGWVDWQTSKLSRGPTTGAPQYQSPTHTWFLWVLGIRTQVHMLVWQTIAELSPWPLSSS